MTPEAFSPDMLDFVRALEDRGVRYLLIGGYAVHIHGYTRVTADVDFAYCPRSENVLRLYGALQDFWGPEVPGLEEAAELMEPGLVVQFGRKPNRIDLINGVKGIEFDEAWSRRIIEPLDGLGFTISVISLRDLRRSKAAAGRLKDLDDLENLPQPIGGGEG